MENGITKKKYIYKYMPINVFTLKALINNELFFSIPVEFNDPLDCKFSLSINAPTREEALQYYKSLNLSKDELENKIKSFDCDNNIFERDLEINYTENLRKEYCITCFSEKFDSILMWSHYAQKHHGICLQFDWRLHEEYFMGFKVKYSKKLPKAFYDGNGVFDGTDIFLTKINFWKYEKEIRAIVKVEDGIQQAAFNPKALTAIIFGEKTSESDKTTIRKIISGNTGYENVKYLQAKINLEKLKVNIS